MRVRVLLAFILSFFAVTVSGQTPPAGSLAARGSWPRLIVTQANRASIRAYIKQHYAAEFQTLINRFDDAAVIAPASAEIAVLNVWGPVNLSFPVALGLQELKDLGFTFPAAYDTEAELCTAAFTYATTPVSHGTAACTPAAPCAAPLSQVASGGGINQSYAAGNYTMRANATSYYLPSVLMADWCQGALSRAQKQAVANAFYGNYSVLFKGQNLLGMQIGSGYHALSNRFTGVADGLLFALTAWGDPDALDTTKQQELYTAFHQIWVNRFLWEVDKFGRNGWNFLEGIDYWTYSGALLLPAPLAAIETALDSGYISSRRFFTEIGTGMAAMTWPEAIGKSTGCGANGASPCPAYTEAWGDNTQGVSQILGAGNCKSQHILTGWARFMGFSADANRQRWIYDNLAATWAGAACAEIIPSSHWANDVMLNFLFGMAGTTASKPLEQNVTLANDYYIFRKDYTPSDTYVFFGASPILRSGHDSSESGSFYLHKFGPLAIKAGNWREGQCQIGSLPEVNLLRNTVGIHSGSNDVTLGAQVTQSNVEPEFNARGISNANYVVGLPPRHSFGPYYSYVFYDADPLWTEATKMQREFVYLRGSTDHEFLVVLDRANVGDVANDPIWKMWTVSRPACVDAACSSPRAGKWVTTGKVVSVTNQHAAPAPFGSPAFATPATNGKMYLKALLPADARIQILGDDGRLGLMYQTGNDDGTIIPFDQASCTTGHYDIYGWGRIEVRPGTVGTTNTFLNVIQFGAASSLAAMAPADTVSSDDGNFVVTRISDSLRTRLVVFAKNASTSPADGAFGYSYLPSAAGSDHLIVNLAPSATYYVASSGTSPISVAISKTNNGGTAKQTDASGVLAFQLGAAGTAPHAPANLRAW